MLETVFNDEKIFNVLEKILHAENPDDVDVAGICYHLEIDADTAADIIRKMEFLEFIINNDNKQKSVDSFKINTDSDLLMALCLFDDLVTEFIKNKVMSEKMDKKENGNFQDMLKYIDLNKISIEDFVKLLNKFEL